jgi:hypothetical protein
MRWMRNCQGFMWFQWQVYLGNSQWYEQVTQALSHIQCAAEQQNVILEESVIQVRARVMAADCIMSILGLWDGPKSYEALEWQGFVLQAWHTGTFFRGRSKLWKSSKKTVKSWLMYCLCISSVSMKYWQCILYVFVMYWSNWCSIGAVLIVYWWCIRLFCHVLWMYWKLYPTTLFCSILCPSPFWGPTYQGIQIWASAAHGYGSCWVWGAMAWQHQTCFLADRACMFQHALLGAVLQKLLLVRHPHRPSTLHAPGLRHWAAVGGQTGPKRQWKVPAK